MDERIEYDCVGEAVFVLDELILAVPVFDDVVVLLILGDCVEDFVATIVYVWAGDEEDVLEGGVDIVGFFVRTAVAVKKGERVDS